MEKGSLIRPGLWAHPKEIPKIKKRLRGKVPKVECYYIGKGPLHKNIVNCLYQNGFQKSAYFLENLFESENSPTNETKSIPSDLKPSEELLFKLADTLKEVEAGEANAYDLVTLAIWLSKNSIEYRPWATKVFEYALKWISEVPDSAFLEAKARYAYGNFLFATDDIKMAIEVLNMAYDLSAGKSWLSFTSEGTLFKDINYLLFLCYTIDTERMWSKDIKIAKFLSRKALNHALEAENKIACSKAYLTLATVQMENGDFGEAISNFNKAIQYAQVSGINEDLCDAFLKKAICVNKMGQSIRAFKCVRIAKMKAMENDLPLYIAKSRMFMGDIQMAKRQFTKASANYMEAFQEFSNRKIPELVTKARCITGLAFSHAIFECYYKLIKSTEDAGNDNLKRLMLWKGTRTPFWIRKNRVYELMETELGFYDEYPTDEFIIINGEIAFRSQREHSLFGWRKVERIWCPKRIRYFYQQIERTIFLNL